ncbi:flagellar hook-basal body complex protein FliE [Halalkalibacter alkaliphilus]|uniref:Flagellar hook-basal body complex protein FliE n=1 Tax=Halalkalibacter alkaliphilus TaxID=2917993 RepID=A0A9X1ZXG2_9BACI|nr:flagellar hook-basal body complex protein FliE [Halalkalibacter alkaliphilus]MCL7746463.1 flagellar hook-basal body complex protein FliE [Halalkalibacter alkaliphilus]
MDMRIQSPFLQMNSALTKTKHTPAEAQASFKNALSQAVKDVNELQNESAKKTELLAKGEIDNLHDVMITGQKASISLQATVEVRNKVVEAYQEIMRMQV